MMQIQAFLEVKDQQLLVQIQPLEVGFLMLNLQKKIPTNIKG